MHLDEKSLRIGAAALLGAVLLRLCMPFLPDERVASLLFFLESGKWVPIEVMQEPPESTPEDDLSPQQPAVMVFSPQQSEKVQVNNPLGHALDTQSLLLRELNWDLTGSTPRVLIIHTHTTESYRNEEGYEALPNSRTLDPAYNMLAVGDLLADSLEQAGIAVLHDRTFHDYPSYNAAYTNSKAAIQQYLQEYPDIALILDIHRDAYEDGKGNQLGYTTTYNGQQAAQLMLVVSAFDSNAQDPKWHENMALAVKLQAYLQTLCEGVARPVAVRDINYNQALGPCTVLVEMGAAGNSQQEALRTTELLAQSIIALAKGAKGEPLA